jgi:DNA/RNA-binding domain of Phe-tRNA-synthetase-like protein
VVVAVQDGAMDVLMLVVAHDVLTGIGRVHATPPNQADRGHYPAAHGDRHVRQHPPVLTPPFRYDAAVIDRFPAVVGGVMVATVVNGPTPRSLADALAAEVDAARQRLAGIPLSEVPSLAAWRRVFRGFGVDPTQYRSAAEALLRRITKGDELPSINALVDTANIVSVRHALPVAVFDTRAVAGGLVVRFADGTERWADLGGSTAEHADPGEVIFADDAGEVSARRWCWRQSRSSAAREDTREILLTVEGHHDDARPDVTNALNDLEALLGTHAGARLGRRQVLDASRPAID